ALLAAAVVAGAPAPALAWGDEGHEIIALVADHYLTPETRRRVEALLATDTDNLTADDMASEGTWADKYAGSDRDTTRRRYDATYRWLVANRDRAPPDPAPGGFGPPAPARGTPPSQAPAEDCVVDKIGQFEQELAAPATPPAERLLALKYLLHFV